MRFKFTAISFVVPAEKIVPLYLFNNYVAEKTKKNCSTFAASQNNSDCFLKRKGNGKPVYRIKQHKRFSLCKFEKVKNHIVFFSAAKHSDKLFSQESEKLTL